MGKVSVFFLVIFVGCVLERSSGWNYFWQTNPIPQDIISYPYLSAVAAPVWDPDCEKNKDSSESSESSSSESSEDSSSSSESDSKEGKESKESKESSESNSEESGGSKEGSKESKEGSEEGGEESEESKESKESKSSEGSSEESKEKKKESKKKKKEPKSLFPPRTFTFPARNFQRIIYSPVSYVPYKSPYVAQPPVASLAAKSAYQYVPATVVRPYAAPSVGKYFSSPVQRIVYAPAPAYNYAPAAKTVLAPGTSVLSSSSWNSPVDFYKKR